MLLPLILVSHSALQAFAFSIPPLPHVDRFLGADHAQGLQQPLQDTLDAWIAREEHIALDKLLANVAPGGRNVRGKGVADGTVIASPSQQGPDYWFQWVRDAAITMNTLVDIYADDTSSSLASNLSLVLDAYSSLQRNIQHTSNPSGTFSDLSGLGEPKFHVDGTPFTGSWGRPQRDGPALRALTLMHYLREYNTSHPEMWSSEEVTDFFGPFYEASMPPNSVIKADLEYVSHFWNQSSFDLWEEIEGLHFFTLMVSARSLREGSALAKVFGDDGAAEWYAEQAGHIEDLLSRFWDAEKKHLVETLDHSRTGLDCGLLLGSLHALPPSDSLDDAVYPPWSDEMLVSLLALTRDQRNRFPINSSPSEDNDDTEVQDSAFEGVGIGRYPEDVYDGYGTSNRGGNPWFLCTSSAAEILYRTASHLSSTSSLTISRTSLPFYEALLATSSLDVNTGVYGPSDALFHSVFERLQATGDEFLDVVRAHVDADGAMSEQFDRVTGFMRGAGDLTWSYGAFLKAVGARKEAKLL
ncbi:glycoside hydrolase family 15 protein [Dothidotthia symphoricarpi CBS 119687]|uniref:glucan 1,4-alpha-glucosidase n=1 Tax=Dothidotthia symphoricarpi CBS 119687 TaxID=1392245 RepID=A0A6A6AEU3_9PLEO|nr:glycoside hydrolase family 15 protein [Dothidotthia symphoricarpi CBS 119687]KAF2129447.1 glycoside hydrolase family 15 protein [Dothidotthia symphoricarpi CBS 119687]